MKEIRVQVDDGTFEGIEERAAAAGIPVDEFAGQVLTEAEQRRRFMAAAHHFAELFTPAFTEEFGYPTTGQGAAAA
ncbi:hypothetical protein ACFVY4_26710 [Streptomyces sp. NPDC058299]|uniref:hypothetical protein n=1 Tax=Streptomyces sp. NPDC058299 TaxID=3346435 RepID=UPI0036E243F4